VTPALRAEHIGSLLRPPALLAARDTGLQGERLRELEDTHIRDAIRMQEALGLQCVTDGEFRRESWRLGFVQKVEGFALAAAVGDVDLQRDDAGNVARIGSAPVAVARVRRYTAAEARNWESIFKQFSEYRLIVKIAGLPSIDRDRARVPVEEQFAQTAKKGGIQVFSQPRRTEYQLERIGGKWMILPPG